MKTNMKKVNDIARCFLGRGEFEVVLDYHKLENIEEVI